MCILHQCSGPHSVSDLYVFFLFLSCFRSSSGIMTSNPADYCIKRYTFHANVGVGSKGKQVGSMNEEPQARGCYNFYLYTNQPGNSVGSPLWWKHEHRPHQQTRQPASAGTRGGKGTLPAQHTTLNTLDNWGHKTPTQSKRKRTGKKRLQGQVMARNNTLSYTKIAYQACCTHGRLLN